MQILAGLQAQLQGAQQTLDAARQQKLYLESLMQQYQTVRSSMGSADSEVAPPQSFEAELVDLRLKLQDLRAKYTDGHPDVIALKDKIAQVERLRKQSESEMAKQPNDGSAGNDVDSWALLEGSHGAPTPIMQLQSQMRANRLEITNIQQHQKELESQIKGYQARLNLTPETEQELTAVARGYDESKTNYDSLLQKQMQSQLATSLEQRQQGQQFRILDPPSYPRKATVPNYLWFSLGGLVAGLSIGLLLTIFLEMTNVRVRQEKDLRGIVPVGVLVAIPHLSTPGEAHARALRWRTELSAATALMVLIVLGNFYAFLKG